MWIKELRLHHLRSFDTAKLNFSRGVNIIVGPNNAGKSSILQSIHKIQNGSEQFNRSDIKKGEDDGFIEIDFEGNKEKYGGGFASYGCCQFNVGVNNIFLNKAGSSSGFSPIPAVEPNNFIYPYFSKRKVVLYNETINSHFTNAVPGNFEHLYPKIDRISNPNNVDAYNYYTRACADILGFQISCVASAQGKKAAYVYNNFESISVDKMGEGVINILGLIVDLCVAKDKLFLIEEPENDIHPKALKALLKLIAEKSCDNQFLITTHSNIVLKTLGSVEGAEVFSTKMEFKNNVPTSEVSTVGRSVEDRRSILEELGYELYDFDLWSGWLFLEESSAERFIRDYFIPWYEPSLIRKLRTFSSRSLSEVKNKFDDFNRLFVYLHLEPTYKDRVWVLIDNGDNEQKVLSEIKEKYVASGWSEDQFTQLSKHDFESYYPARFSEEVETLLEISGKKEKRKAKKELLERVVLWCNEEPKLAKEEFRHSAAEVLTILRKIQRQL